MHSVVITPTDKLKPTERHELINGIFREKLVSRGANSSSHNWFLKSPKKNAVKE